MSALLVTLALAAENVMNLTTPAFAPGGTIPARHTCEGEGLSPALGWSGAPAGTRGFALVVEDPDAPGGTFVHWIAWGLPPTASSLPEGVTADAPGLVQGVNGFRTRGYGGPCPPKGAGAHRYVFRVYAVDRPVGLPAGATRAELDLALKDHVLATGETMGKSWRDR
jgi:Raf kinase inhibitor-like YbhB/YbcL family protein